MGVKRVSADQILEAQLEASYTVLVSAEISEEEKSSLSHQELDSKFTPAFTLHKALDPVDTATDTEIQHKPKQDEVLPETGLRKRNLKDFEKLTLKDSDSDETKNQTETSSSENNRLDDKKTDTKSKQRKLFNPLNLFGILVPRELRTSQNQFEQALALAVTVSNLKQRLQSLQVDYRTLRGVKAES